MNETRLVYRYDLIDCLEEMRHYPFVKIIIPLLLGIIFQYLSLADGGKGLPVSGLLFIAFFFTSLAVLNIFNVHRRRDSFTWLYGVHYCLMFFFLGIVLVQLNPLKSTVPLNKENYFELLVVENPENTEKSLRIDVEIRAFSDDGKRWSKCDERSIIYMDKNTSTKFHPGDVLITQTVFNAISPPQNPEEFDVREYFKRKKIFSTSFVNAENIVVVDSGQISPYRKFVFALQQYSLETLQKAKLQSEELAVALALLIGNKQYLEDELRDSYAASGTVHLLAVSGLHVGIVFLILNIVLRFMNRKPKLRLVKGFIILVSLWTYASVAGLASSIVRASSMFSIFIIADMTGKPKSTYNNIALSCFIMCLLNPYVIFETGFQLSYFAVLSIVYFQPKFMKPFYLCNKFIKPVIECTTVTLSAQLGTLPVILLTFKLFPTYFIFSNLLLVPYTSLVMYIGVTVIAFSWQSFLLTISGAVLNFSIYLMNSVVKFFDKLPFSTIDGIYINGIQCFLLVVSILSTAFLLLFKRRIFSVIILISLIGIFSIAALRSREISSHKEFGVFGVKRAFYAYFIENGTGFSIRDTSSIRRSFDFNTKNYLIKRGFNSEQNLTSFSLTDTVPNMYKGVVLFTGKKIALSSQLEINTNFSGTPLNVDYLYITERHKAKPETILSCYNPSEIVIANNLPSYLIDKWIEIAESKKIPYHNIKTDGGFCKYASGTQ